MKRMGRMASPENTTCSAKPGVMNVGVPMTMHKAVCANMPPREKVPEFHLLTIVYVVMGEPSTGVPRIAPFSKCSPFGRTGVIEGFRTMFVHVTFC